MKQLERLIQLVEARSSILVLCDFISNKLHFDEGEPHLRGVAYRQRLEGLRAQALTHPRVQRDADALETAIQKLEADPQNPLSVHALLEWVRSNAGHLFTDTDYTDHLPDLALRSNRKAYGRVLTRPEALQAFADVLRYAYTGALSQSHLERDPSFFMSERKSSALLGEARQGFKRDWPQALEWAGWPHGPRSKPQAPLGEFLRGHAYLRRVLFEQIAPAEAFFWTDLFERKDLPHEDQACLLCVTDACLTLYWV